MKKSYILIIIFMLFIIFISIIGSIIVTGDKLIKNNNDVLEVQNNKDKYFNSYGYTIDNPNIIVNPYGNSPLTALIMFDTDDYSEVSICIKGKNDNDINYTFDKNKHHLLPIYGLYADYNNTVIISSEGKVKSINIETGKLPDDFEYVDGNNNDNYSFFNGNYPYAIDSYGDVRWYLNSNYYGNITVLDNGKIVIGSDRYTENNNTISLYEMNLLGKIYNEYLLSDSYYGYNTIYDDNILLLSDKVLLIDRQSGTIITDYGDNDNYDYIGVVDDKIIAHNDNGYYTLSKKKKINIDININFDSFNLYSNVSNYDIVPSNRYGTLNSTPEADKNFSLIKYKNKDIKSVDIEIDSERIKVVNNNESNIYVILDKFLDKRIYEVNDVKYINTTSLNGKYTIYYSINGKIYNTGKYIEVK